MAKMAVCKTHKDCFAYRDGNCVSLSDNDFGGRECPFFKSKKEVSWDEIQAACAAYAESHGGKEEVGK